MKHLFWVLICCLFVVGCQPPASSESGTGGGAAGGAAGGGEEKDSNATDDAASLDLPGETMNTSVVKFEVPGMSCPIGCAPAVKATLELQPGVTDCNVEFESRIATCRVTNEFDAEKALAALQANEQFASSKLAQ